MDNCRISCQVMADMEKYYNDLIIINLYACYSRNWSQKWEDCKNQTNYWTLKTIVLDLAWLKKKCFEETIAIVGSFHSNYLLDWLDIFSECLTLPVRAPTVLNLPFFDRKLIKSVPIATIVIQWKFDSNNLLL